MFLTRYGYLPSPDHKEENVYRNTLPACCSGSSKMPVYHVKRNRDGVDEVVKTDEVDLYAEIQAGLEGCLIENVLAAARGGDTSRLMAARSVYADVTGLPKDILGVDALMKESREAFFRLPADLRSEFDNNLGAFVRGMNAPDFAARLNKYFSPDTPVVPTESGSSGAAIPTPVTE